MGTTNGTGKRGLMKNTCQKCCEAVTLIHSNVLNRKAYKDMEMMH